jgi:hypothetical protein
VFAPVAVAGTDVATGAAIVVVAFDDGGVMV